jgi:signal transduction histidine kinase/ActR/RegA family two-component response regulator
MWSLQHKAWVLVIAVVSALTAAAVWFSTQSISASFDVLESTRAEQEGERARRLLQQYLVNLSALGEDYASRSEAVQFVAGTNPDFLDVHFSREKMQALRLSGVLVFDAQGQLLDGRSLTAEVNLAPISPLEQQAAEALVSAVVSDPRSETVINTYRQIGGTLYMISVAPVREPLDVSAPPKGAQVVFRRFGAFEHWRFSQALLSPVTVAFNAAQVGTSDLALRVLSESRAEARAVVRDHQNQPVAQLVVGLDRLLHLQGRSLVWASALQVAVAGLVMGTLLVLLLDRLMLRRLERMHRQLAELDEQGAQAETPIDETGQDELSDLARGLNRVLVLTRQVAQEREIHATQEAQQLSRVQADKAEALRKFVRGIAHDFNNSLAAITGWQRLAMEDLGPDHPSQEAVLHAQKATRYATDLMRQLQAYTRHTAPKLQRLSLADLLESARSLFDPKRAAGCKVEVTCLTDDTWVQADPTQLQQVLVNLLANASDAMNGVGTIRLELSSVELPAASVNGTASSLPAGRYVCLTVRDEGTGIAPEHIDQLFDPFFTTKPVGRGTGLGLPVARGVMINHGGALDVQSQLGQGAAFSLYLPLAAKPLPSADVLSTGSPSRGAMRMLFVDDDQLVRQAWSNLLQRDGWQVTQACDGEDGWAQFVASEQRWDVVLTDLAMPQLDGRGLALRIQDVDARMPVILMSGHVSSDDVQTPGAQPFAAVLHKPVDPEELFRVLAEVCEQASSRVAGTQGMPATNTVV